jgi:acyl-coenzyme A synthetase/AMP-(fatty) acid ligase
MDELPKNVNGKIDRRSIREHFEAEASAEPARQAAADTAGR